MQKTYNDILISIYQAHRPMSDGLGRQEYTAFAAVSGLSSRREGICVYNQVEDWTIDNEGPWHMGSPSCRKAVKIVLPDGVHYGEYEIAGVSMTGLHGQYSARDGMGRSVYVFCEPVEVVDDDYETAIDTAVAGGIYLSVPTETGDREIVPVETVASSELF